jgi:DNA topoisomerase-1
MAKILETTNGNLVLVNDKEPGISRKRKGKKFSYYFNKKEITEEKKLERYKKLAIPPSWKEVWICRKANGHLQATGLDLRKRKQYRYHSSWSAKRNEKKFDRLAEFGKTLSKIRSQIEKDISVNKLSSEKVLATVVRLMEKTFIRIGNSVYEKENGSYGLTTLKDKHVSIKGSELKLSFVGKKGIHHSISLESKQLANIVRKCRDIPGHELFQYYDEEGNPHAIDSGMVNEYIRRISNSDFSAKDFRTWAGTVNILRAFKKIGMSNKKTITKKKIVEALNYVSEKLGNTNSICKKYYVHPLLISMYENNSLEKYLNQMNGLGKENKKGLNSDEKLLLRILKNES